MLMVCDGRPAIRDGDDPRNARAVHDRPIRDDVQRILDSRYDCITCPAVRLF